MASNIKRISTLYEDITDYVLQNATPKSNNIIFDKFFIDDQGTKHPIKGQEKISLSNKESEEYKMAKTLRNILGGKIHIVPRIETEKGYKGLVKVNTPDYIWNNEKWDLKIPSNNGRFDTSIERFFKKSKVKKQARKYIIDLKNYSNKSNKEIIILAQKTLNNPHRDFIDELLLLKNKEIIKIFSKNKKDPPTS